MAFPNIHLATVIAAGTSWSTGLAVYAIRYWPVLSRIDAKPG